MQYLRKTEQDWCNSSSSWQLESWSSCNHSRQTLPLLLSSESAGAAERTGKSFLSCWWIQELLPKQCQKK